LFNIKNKFVRQLFGSLTDLLPIFVVIFVFQIFVLRQPVPNLADIAIGTAFVVLGLTLFYW